MVSYLRSRHLQERMDDQNRPNEQVNLNRSFAKFVDEAGRLVGFREKLFQITKKHDRDIFLS